jgi:hypothetical protein
MAPTTHPRTPRLLSRQTPRQHPGPARPVPVPTAEPAGQRRATWGPARWAPARTPRRRSAPVPGAAGDGLVARAWLGEEDGGEGLEGGEGRAELGAARDVEHLPRPAG